MIMLRRNVLIFHLGALGDFLLTWPLALALARLHPQSRIVYVTHAQKGKLAERILGVESTSIEAGWHHLYGNADLLPIPARRLLEGAHAIYSFIADADDAWSRQATAVSGGALLHCLHPTPVPEAGLHATEHLLGQLTGLPALREAVRLLIQSIRQRGMGRPPAVRGPVVIHPGSGSEAKCWPSEHFAELARRLARRGAAVRIVLGETEIERWSAQRIALFKGLGEIRRPADVLELHQSLADATTFIGNDSGPGHLAGILGLATISLFGPSDPAVWQPLGPRVAVLRRTPIDAITVDEVEALAVAALGQ